jgi:preprotein translocase subunit YajC
MKMETSTKQRIAKNAFLSLFLFLLPILAMFVTFYFTGERPWENKKQQQLKDNNTSVTKKTNTENGSND